MISRPRRSTCGRRKARHSTSRHRHRCRMSHRLLRSLVLEHGGDAQSFHPSTRCIDAASELLTDSPSPRIDSANVKLPPSSRPHHPHPIVCSCTTSSRHVVAETLLCRAICLPRSPLVPPPSRSDLISDRCSSPATHFPDYRESAAGPRQDLEIDILAATDR